jgi:hypothetical protein
MTNITSPIEAAFSVPHAVTLLLQNPVLEGISPTKQAEEKANQAREKLREQLGQLGHVPVQTPIQTPILDPNFLAFAAEVEAEHTGEETEHPLERENTVLEVQRQLKLERERKAKDEVRAAEQRAANEAAFLEVHRQLKLEQALEQEEDEELMALVSSRSVFSDEDEARYEAYHQDQFAEQVEDQVQADQVQCAEYLAQNAFPVPGPRALSTKNKAQLEEADRRRADKLELERIITGQAGPIVIGSKITDQMKAQLEAQTSCPITDEDREMEATFQQMALFLDAPQVAQLDLKFHWNRAKHLLEPVKTKLKTAYAPTLVVLTLASSAGRSSEDLERMHRGLGVVRVQGSEEVLTLERPDTEFFVAMWEIAAICKITPDYLRKIFHKHEAKLRRIFHHHDYKTQTTFKGESQVLIVGCLFRLRWPVSGATQYTPELLEQSRKTQTVYTSLTNRSRVYRDLDADVQNKHTQAAYRTAHKITTNPRGEAKNLTSSDEFPEEFALELLTYCVGRIRGLSVTNVSSIEQFANQVTSINVLCNVLEQPLERGHNRLETRVRRVANLLCESLGKGSESHQKLWMKVCWTLYRTQKITWLYQAVWDVLIRGQDLGTIRSKGALVMHLLNARGYGELRASLEAQHPEAQQAA